MGSLPPVHEEGFGRLITYSVDGDESTCEAIVSAFDLGGVDVADTETVLHDWIDTDALERLNDAPGQTLRISTYIWDHPVVITSDAITVYADGATAQQEVNRGR